VPNAGLFPAAVLAQRIDLPSLIDERVKPAQHAASSGTKALTVFGSMPVGGDSIDNVAVLRAGAAGSLFDGTRAPRGSGGGCARTSGQTSASLTRSAVTCSRGCGPRAPARPISRRR
jgi:hypothetical protein